MTLIIDKKWDESPLTGLFPDRAWGTRPLMGFQPGFFKWAMIKSRILNIK